MPVRSIPSKPSRARIPQSWRGALNNLRERPASNVPALDVLRCCAILLVFSRHLGGPLHAPAWIYNSPVVYYGWSGVDLFFVLSGLLIGAQLWRELQRTGSIRIWQFLLRRGMRIWPLYFAFVAALAVAAVFNLRSGDGLWADALCVSNYVKGQLGGGWSLATEEQFYILAPVTIAITARFVRIERLWVIPVTALIAGLGSRIEFAWHSPLSEAALRDALYKPIHTHADGLAVGLLLAWVLVVRPWWIKRTATRWATAATMLAAAVVVYRAGSVITGFTALALVYGAAVLIGAQATWTPGIVRWHGWYTMSRLSFGMYLNHFALRDRLPRHLLAWMGEGTAAFFASYAILLVLSLLIATVSFVLIEWPFLRMREQKIYDTAVCSAARSA